VIEPAGVPSEQGRADIYARPGPALPTYEVVASVRGVAKEYGPRVVLDGLDADFAAGRLTAVTGPSGSGKTTLLHLLAGLDTPDSGEVVVLGRAPDTELRRTELALVAQDTPLVPFLTARETVELVLELRHADRAAAVEALAAVGLGELIDERIARLSTGERQRVAIARALATRPRLLLADEPTARLDEANARTVGALFARLAAETGTAIVCATHDPALIDQADATCAL
jgi:putative ABC transport system ATP-binding protein